MDPVQESLLLEKCVLVDANDEMLGSATKKECHLVQGNNNIKLHRAFSVFLFNNRGELLIQKRSAQKLTYPNRYSNTCCSHPLANINEETETIDALGIKRAALRKIQYELGIKPNDLSIEDMIYVTRIHYKDLGDGTYGEHEIDYIIFIKKNVKLKLNFNEVAEVRYVSKRRFEEFLTDMKGQLTPWFEMIVKYKLRFWWDHLDRVEDMVERNIITRLELK